MPVDFGLNILYSQSQCAGAPRSRPHGAPGSKTQVSIVCILNFNLNFFLDNHPNYSFSGRSLAAILFSSSEQRFLHPQGQEKSSAGDASLWPIGESLPYSHSIVPGGLLVMSYTTRLTPSTSLTIRFDIRDKSFVSAGNQSAVMPSTLWTRRMTTTLW